MGFSDRETVALSGAHGLGRWHAANSRFEGKWANNPTRFSNQYFRLLLSEDWAERTVAASGNRRFVAVNSVTGDELMMLPTDMALAADPAFREYVEPSTRSLRPARQATSGPPMARMAVAPASVQRSAKAPWTIGSAPRLTRQGNFGFRYCTMRYRGPRYSFPVIPINPSPGMTFSVPRCVLAALAATPAVAQAAATAAAAPLPPPQLLMPRNQCMEGADKIYYGIDGGQSQVQYAADLSITSSVTYNDMADSIDGGEDATDSKRDAALLGFGANEGQRGVVAKSSNPAYQTPEYKDTGAKPEGIVIKLIDASDR
ncbi:hypothetical protein GGTG_05543 [Gaeumannomyces tritici R3-111a-1]|uniref:Peroxidase n=1 Tax=Gaeumannomyces tritici (strain R3-111a-1) TaxID=644352 RepID=J3NW78_GAET3|nr:hypothetical protein GGTG_05543 [Gaeumannomyces tritici R3-111a-1]EJT75610.1 hypothetical protein GGTG_05543 [Gaeumannomyces tritici R3-111a-1]